MGGFVKHRVWLIGLALLALVAAWIVWPKQARSGEGARLFYEIVVTAPGTRSQGWHGTLFHRDGSAYALPAMMSVNTNAGVFAGVACAMPWAPCGAIHADQLAWMKTHGGNVVMDRGAWSFRLYAVAECSRSEGWRGELLHNGRPVPLSGKRVRTPMGPFVRKASPHLWGQNGWFPASWSAPMPAPGNWPCAG